jgi:hypothetical protein
MKRLFAIFLLAIVPLVFYSRSQTASPQKSDLASRRKSICAT